MLTIKEFIKVQSLEEAYELNQKKSSQILGGMLWLKMQNRIIQTAIDLSGLGLDQIEESEDAFKIGCMVSLRDLEIHQALATYTMGAMKESLRHIVGVQFRNSATVGGSIFGRYGFSDVLTMFLAMDSYVTLYKGGTIPLKEFVEKEMDRDILIQIIVKKKPLQCVYLSQRNTKTDFPVLTCAVSNIDGKYQAVIGARPHKGVVIEDKENILTSSTNIHENIVKFAEYVQNQIVTGSNTRASKEYRSLLVKVLTTRACKQLCEK